MTGVLSCAIRCMIWAILRRVDRKDALLGNEPHRVHQLQLASEQCM